MRLTKHAIHVALSRAFPEQRLFLRSDTETRFVRLSPSTQILALSGSALVVGWTIVASAILLMDGIGSDTVRQQTMREQTIYQQRLNDLAAERDAATAEARAAHERFNAALARVSDMQSELLASELRRDELDRGMQATQVALRRTIAERDDARGTAADLRAVVEGDSADGPSAAERMAEVERTLDYLTAALGNTATQRDAMAAEAADAEAFAEDLMLDAKLTAARSEQIFAQLEEALTISVAPLDKMFRSAGLSTDSLIDTVRRSYSGQGGPLVRVSTKGQADPLGERANGILEKLDRMNLYRLAAEKAPFSMPLKDSFRYTSSYGPRWGRAHEGTDMAGAHGTAIYATADGVVTFAGTQSGYGKLVKIRHAFGIETRYAHQSNIRVKVGQKVSRGDRIGDMGNTGRSTGTHLHYEVRVNGKAVNPMTFIKAAKDVF
ncbi:peptidase, M23/M37 family protein [Oceaniovalibus guishaninsula JLT2003]|uniref:Peptidase, M23/M37 family protein n=1 Tax=Oceaniovalibus guishaninsula JLT2003 TaxID=1231392 RepID=K2GNR9_9RHOB|nr:M23 family metallopeptidase [Oceaniovalibus guishaninsula]EKE44316.1 peptidase, M23/M37 family protein [Oceaniovalibus guishaninsula JLT2003]